VIAKGVKERAEFRARDGVDAASGARELLECGEDAVVGLGDDDRARDFGEDAVERLGVRFENDADGVLGERVFQVEGEKNRELDSGRTGGRVFYQQTW
jgi:hypothetical protein